MTTLREQIVKAEVGGQKSEVGRHPTSVLRPPISVLRPPIAGRRDLRGCAGCRKKMLAKMKARRQRAAGSRQQADDKEPHT